MLSIGTVFLYGTNGVCRVDEIRREKIRGEEQDYYILTPLFSRTSTIHIPVNSAYLREKMRPILTPEQARELAQRAPYEPTEWIADDAERGDRFRRIIAECDRRELIRMLKTIYTHRRELIAIGRRLHSADEIAWRYAEKIVREEMAHVLKLEPEKVMAYLFERDQAAPAN